MNKEFVMRGQTASGGTEVLNFSGNTPGYAYRMTEFALYPSTNIQSATYEITGTVTAAKTAEAPTDPNFNNEGLIATTAIQDHHDSSYSGDSISVVNDLFLITQDLILMVQDTTGAPINWQCRFVAEKLVNGEEALANYKQFTISDG